MLVSQPPLRKPAARSERTQVTGDAVLIELAKLGFANMLDYIKVQPTGVVVDP